MKVRFPYRLLVVGPPLLFLAAFYFYPLASIFGLSFSPEGGFDSASLKKLVTSNVYARTLWFTFWQAAVSTLLTLALALPGAWVFARYTFPGKKLLMSLTTVPFVLPTVVVAAAFRALLARHGVVNVWLIEAFDLTGPPIRLEQTVWFFLLAHVFYNYTVVLRLVGGFWAGLGTELTDAARLLGASRSKVFFKITLPLLRPALWTAALLIFIFCFTSFGVILILGGPGLGTLEVEIFRQAVHLFNLPMAAALSLIQIAFTFGLMWAYTNMSRRTAVALDPASLALTQRRARGIGENILVWGNLGLMLVLLGSPLLALVWRSFSTQSGPGLTYYLALFQNASGSLFFVSPGRAVVNSLGFALIAAFLATVLGLMASAFLAGPKSRLGSFLDPLFMLPLSTSAVTLGFGFLIALDEPPLNLRTSILLAPLAHTLVAFPFVVRSLLPALRSIPKSLREAAAMLGASPWRAWRAVDLPIVGRAVLVGAVFAFAVSMGEFGATVFVARPQTPTMPLAVYRFLGQPGALNYGQAMAMSSLLMLVTAAGFFFLEKVRVGRIGEF